MIQFDLKIIEINAINVFVNCDLNKIFHMKKLLLYKNMQESQQISNICTIFKDEEFLKAHFIKLDAEFD